MGVASGYGEADDAAGYGEELVVDATDVRASVPICTPSQAAEHAGMPLSTFYTWMKPTSMRPALIHHVEPITRGWPTIPLIGLAEATVLREMRGRMRMPQIAAAVTYLRDHGGEYALGNPHLMHDGFQAAVTDEAGDLHDLVTGHPMLPGVVSEWLQPFKLAPDGFVESLLVSRIPGVEIDPRFSSGRMRFTRTGIPVFAIAGALEAEDPPDVVAAEYGLTLKEVNRVRQHLPWLSAVA